MRLTNRGPQEGSERIERWPKRWAHIFTSNLNELGTEGFAAGILALEREDPDYEPDFVVDYRQKV